MSNQEAPKPKPEYTLAAVKKRHNGKGHEYTIECDQVRSDRGYLIDLVERMRPFLKEAAKFIRRVGQSPKAIDILLEETHARDGQDMNMASAALEDGKETR